jgi:hypothetical protein
LVLHYVTNEVVPSTVAYRHRTSTVEGTDPKVNILVSLGPMEESYTMPDLVNK